MVDVRLQTAAGHVWAGGLRFDAEKTPKMQKPRPPTGLEGIMAVAASS